MSGQFELGAKHLECIKQAKENLAQIEETNPKAIIKSLLAKTYGFIPSESKVYDDYLGLCVAIEELAKQNPLVASVLADQVLLREILKAYGNENAQNFILNDETIGLLCSESGFTNITDIKTKAVKTDDGWHVEGVKQICNEQLTSDKYLVFAKDEDNKVRLFVIAEEKLTITENIKNIGSTRIALAQAEVNVNLSDSNNVGVIENDFEATQTIARTLIAASSVGIAQSALITAVKVAKEVKNPEGQAISTSQNVQFTLADMFSETEAARMLTYYSADSIDKNTPSIKIATMAKVKASDAASNVAMDSLQLLGNIGYISNSDFSSVILRAVDSQVKGGTNRTQESQIYKYMLAKK